MAKSKLSGALAFGAALMLLPVAAAASEHSEEQSEAQPQIITPEEFLEDVLGLIERYGQHGSGDDEAEGQWRHAPPLEEDLPEGQWHHAPPLEDDDLRLRTTIPGITTMPHGVRRHHSRTMSPIWIVPS